MLRRPELAALSIAGPVAPWRALGFDVQASDRIAVGGIVLVLGGEGAGITGWTLRHVQVGGDIDGLATTVTADQPGPGRPHPNGVVGVDHVVIVTPDFDRTVAALDARGVGLRRTRQAGDRRQGFRRLGPAIMELVEAPEAPRPAFWGITFTMSDLHAADDALADHLSEVRDAVQPGRQIATLKATAGLSMPVAFMDADPT